MAVLNHRRDEARSGRPRKPFRRLTIVTQHAVAVAVVQRQVIHGERMALLGAAPQEIDRLDSAAIHLVKHRKIIQSADIAPTVGGVVVSEPRAIGGAPALVIADARPHRQFLIGPAEIVEIAADPRESRPRPCCTP